jgi:hypothetical protein
MEKKKIVIVSNNEMVNVAKRESQKRKERKRERERTEKRERKRERERAKREKAVRSNYREWETYSPYLYLYREKVEEEMPLSLTQLLCSLSVIMQYMQYMLAL